MHDDIRAVPDRRGKALGAAASILRLHTPAMTDHVMRRGQNVAHLRARLSSDSTASRQIRSQTFQPQLRNTNQSVRGIAKQIKTKNGKFEQRPGCFRCKCARRAAPYFQRTEWS